jgi:dolichol-phosphate mannosyltransferase
MKKELSIIVILPVYNEGESIYNLLLNYDVFFKKYHIEKYKILVINDYSKDESEYFINKAMNEFGNIFYHKHDENKGLSGALVTGFNEYMKLGNCDIVVTMDGDNTHNPFLIRDMILKIDEGADIVIASRYLEQSRIFGLTKFRILLSYGAKILYSIKWRINGVKDYTCNFRAYRASVLSSALSKYGDNFITEKGFTCTTEILKKTSYFSKINVEVPMILRYDNKLEVSNMRIFKTIVQTLKLLFKVGK